MSLFANEITASDSAKSYKTVENARKAAQAIMEEVSERTERLQFTIIPSEKDGRWSVLFLGDADYMHYTTNKGHSLIVR